MTDYSVLMSVYALEKPEYLKAAIESILTQTKKTNDFVLVCDGPLNESLDEVIANFVDTNPGLFNVVRLDKNMGLAKALNAGIEKCKNDIVVRMDSDDISLPDRVEKQLKAMDENGADIVGSNIMEFVDHPTNTTNARIVPETDEEIKEFAKKRSPFNHPSVVYKKSKVLLVGAYGDYQYFEDYSLWIALLQNGCLAYNVQEELLLMRAGDELYNRRGGKHYCKCIYNFKKYMKDVGYISTFSFITQTTARIVVSIMPNSIRRKIYTKKLRG